MNHRKIIAQVIAVWLIVVLLKKAPPIFEVGAFEIKIIEKTFLFLVTIFLIRRNGLIVKNLIHHKSFLTNSVSSFIIIALIFHAADYSSGNAKPDTIEVYLFLVSNFCVALFEEYFFRVFIYLSLLAYFGNKNIIKAILSTSIVFGLAHLSNLFSNGIVSISVIVQIVFAFGIGLILQSVFVRSKNIFLPIAIHTAINYFGTIQSKFTDAEKVVTYDLSGFYFSMIMMIFFVIFFAIPLSYLLIKPVVRDLQSNVV